MHKLKYSKVCRLAIPVVTLAYILAMIIPLLSNTEIDLIGIGANAILTIGLLYLYRKIVQSQEKQTEIQESQSETQSKQADIMESQAEILLMNQTPIIVVEDIRGDNNDILLTLSNIGDGYLRELSVKMNYIPVDPGMNESGYNQDDFDSVILVHPSREGIGGGVTGGSVLAPNEESVTFRANAQLPALKPRGGVTTDFSHAIQEAYDEEISEIAFQIILVYRSVVPGSKRVQYGLEPRKLLLDQPDITFSEALDMSQSTRQYSTGNDSPLVSLGPATYDDERATGKMLNRL